MGLHSKFVLAVIFLCPLGPLNNLLTVPSDFVILDVGLRRQALRALLNRSLNRLLTRVY